MTKRLFLVRHATAEEKLRDQKDIDRALTSAGIREATLLGRHIFQNYNNPSFIVCSPALRTSTTAQLMAEQLKFDTEKIVVDENIYDASVRNLLDVIHKVDDYMDTGSMLVLDFEVERWSDLEEKAGGIVSYTIGRELKNS